MMIWWWHLLYSRPPVGSYIFVIVLVHLNSNPQKNVAQPVWYLQYLSEKQQPGVEPTIQKWPIIFIICENIPEFSSSFNY
jgi:hypothetical protein